MSHKKIFLVGLPGAGKTTLGKRIAERLELDFYDLDDEIIKRTGKPITDTFDQKGEAYFRGVERDALIELIAEKSSFVLATGGGTPCFHENMHLMNHAGVTIFINTPLKTIKSRLINDSKRPLMKKYSLEELIEKRGTWYEQAAIQDHDLYAIVKALKNS